MDERRNTMTEENIIDKELDELTDEENKAAEVAPERHNDPQRRLDVQAVKAHYIQRR